MNIRFIKSPEKREIVEQLNTQFGISELRPLLIESGKEKIRGYTGSLNKDEIIEIAQLANVESIGLYMIKKEHDLRLSFDALHLLKEQISKNVIKINEEEYNLWIRGFDLPIKAQKGTLAISYNNDFIGCGKSDGEKIINHVPKERRLRK